ncbi:MAG: hypothetical protein ACFB9M_11845 [Myxococcota bacterium]
MTTIRNIPFIAPVRGEGSGSTTGSEASTHSRPDVEFRRETSNARRLYEQTRLRVESERSESLVALREAVKNGTYRPNLLVVAERLAIELAADR